MKIEVKKIDPTKRELYIELEGEIVRNKFEDVTKRISKEAKVAGFRPGYVPLDILEKHYGDKIKQEVLEELIPTIYNQAIEKEKLEVVDLPQIYEVKLDKYSLSFKAKVEVLPDLSISNYRKIKINYKKVDVSEEEVSGYIKSLAEKRKIQKIDDFFARSLGYPDFLSLKESVKMQLFIQKETDSQRKVEQDILDHLLKESKFNVPQALLERKLADLVKQAKWELLLKGLSKEEIEAKEKELTEDLKPQAERQAKIQIILTYIAKQQNIPEDENVFLRTMEFLLKEADWNIIS
ncbi:MAG: hypothetical protein NC900_03405 [Candidatus Omnitrophica bacterium]|nr:hypothetical protein [Candidatus Omnitrophota bacterium]MCM8799765.1 hypothetical protein [Candidatus Omnitrophota bacterium]